MSQLWKGNFITTCFLVGTLALTSAWARRSDSGPHRTHDLTLQTTSRSPSSLRSLAAPMDSFFLRATGNAAVLLEGKNNPTALNDLNNNQAHHFGLGTDLANFSSENFRLDAFQNQPRLGILRSAYR